MKLEIERPFVEKMIGEFPRLSSWTEQARLGRKIEVPFHLLSADELTFLARLYADAGPGTQNQAAHVSSILRAQGNAGLATSPR